MSSISSCDSYHISVDDDDDPYTKRMDELEEQYSGSDSGSNDAASNVENNMKRELEIISLYLKCKKGIYTMASNKYKTYSDALLILSLLFSGSLVVFPLFSAEKTAMSSLGLLTMFCIFFKNYYKHDITSHNYNMVSLNYHKLQLNAENFLSRLVYFSNRIEKQTVFYEKMREILKKLGFNRYFEHIQYINSILGIKPPVMSDELQDTLCVLFIEIQEPWAIHCPAYRTNFFNCTYTLYQLCVLLDQTQYLPFIPMMKDREKQLEQDMVWKKVCDTLDWEFVATV